MIYFDAFIVRHRHFKDSSQQFVIVRVEKLSTVNLNYRNEIPI